MVGKTVIWGCDIAEVCSIIINDFVLIKVSHNDKMQKVHIEQLEII